MTRPHRWCIHWLVPAAIAMIACDDEGGGAGEVTVDAGRDAGIDAGARDAMVDAAPALECAVDEDCDQPPKYNPMQPSVVTCCYKEGAWASAPRCSARSDAGVCAMPAIPDPRPATNPLHCEPLVIRPLMNLVVPGCCTTGTDYASGWCGIDSTRYGLGCQQIGDPALRALFSETVGVSIPYPPVRPCSSLDGGVPDGGTQDGGMQDADVP